MGQMGGMFGQSGGAEGLMGAADTDPSNGMSWDMMGEQAPQVSQQGGTSAGQYGGPDPLGAFQQAPDMSQYSNMGGLMSPIQQTQRQRSTPDVDKFLMSLMG